MKSSYLLTPALLSLLITSAWAAGNDAESHQAAPSNAPITALANLTSLKDLKGDAALKTPHVVSFKTSTDTPTLFVAANELPMVDIRLTFDAGSARDNAIRPGLFGLASLTSQLLDEGTSTQDTDDIAATFEKLGANYSASAYRDMFVVNLRVLADAKHFNPAVDELLSILKDAQFPQSSIDRVMNSAAIGQQQRQESPAAIVGIRFYRELYGRHPYAEPTTGTEASLKQITPADIRKFKDTFLVARNLNIAITGQLSTSQAKSLANRITANLPLGQKAAELPDPAPLTASHIVPINFDATQSHVMMGQIGIKRDNPDRYALSVGNEVLGGSGFNALLMKELREKRGLTYGAYSSFTPMHSNGPFAISYSTRSTETATSIQVAQQTLKDFLLNPVDPNLLAETKEGMLNSYPLSLASNENINGYLAAMGFYDFPITYMADYPKLISAVTAEQVHDAMNKYVHPDQMLTVVVGKPFDVTSIGKLDITVKNTNQPAASNSVNSK